MDSPALEPSELSSSWPSLPFERWQETCATLHLWSQIVGKVRLALSPPVNHWWHCALYVSPRGLTTPAMPYQNRLIEMEFDLVEHKLHIRTSDPSQRILALGPRSVSDLYREFMAKLKELDVSLEIYTKPQEIPDAIPFEKDDQHASYDAEFANRFWRALASIEPIFEEFRGRFLGKCSPVNFYWGSFDLAVTRFSGRPAPPRRGIITSEAYSHECISAGFWPGAGFGKPAFYSYTAPAPNGLQEQQIKQGFYSTQLSEFVLPYDEVRNAASPKQVLMEFLQSSYDAGANLANWDRTALERAD
jgi:hypothetical protein